MENNFYYQFSARGMRGFVLGFMLLMGLSTFGQTTVFIDDFQRSSLSPGGTPSMTYSSTTSTGATNAITSTAYLTITSTASATPGRSYVTGPLSTYSSPFNTTLSSNSGTITWTFNVRKSGSSATDALSTAFSTTGKAGVAIILASSSATVTNTGVKGYAVTLSGTDGTTTTTKVNLCSFSDGFASTPTSIIGTTTDYTNANYLSVRVTYEALTNTWALFVRNDGAAFVDPASGVTTQIGSNTVDNTNTSVAMTSFGFLYNHPANTNVARFDNFKVTVTPPPASSTTYYYKGTGDLHTTSNWGINTDGTGAAPANFTADNQIFNIRNTSAVSTTAPWTVSGSSSKIIVGDPSVSAVALTVASGSAITGAMDVTAASSGSNSVVLLDATTQPTFGTLHSTSEVHYQVAATFGLSASYGKLFFDQSSGTTTPATSTASVQTSLTIGSDATLLLSATNNTYIYLNTGATATINGTLRTSKTAGFVSFSNASGNNNSTTGTALQFQAAESGNLILSSSSTIEFSKGNSGTAQIINPRTDYANLTISDGSTAACNKTISSPVTVSGVLTINHVFASTITTCANITLANGASINRKAGSLDAAPTFAGTVNTIYGGTTDLTTGAEMPASVASLTINGTGLDITLSEAKTVGTLTLTAGNVILGNNNLTVTTISGGSSSSYVATTGTGNLINAVGAGATQNLPIGASTSSYDPLTVTPTGATTFTVNVKSAFTNAVATEAKTVVKEWNIASSAPSSTSLEFTPSDGSGLTETTSKVGHYTGGAWTEIAATRSGNTWTATTTSFSPFGVGNAGGFDIALPVEYTNFQVKSNQKSALLTWTTASEKDNALFNIEQSTNGTDFQTVGQVKGHGTTSASSSYNFEHMTPSVGINYYRLKQVDLGGTATYSAVRSVLFGKTGLVVKNTLVQDALDIVTNDDTATPLSIFNLSGQAVFTGKVQGAQRLNISTLPNGLYIVRTATGDVARFVKQ